MFGYVRPVLDRLDKEQRDAYQSAYCGLCHTLGRRHGFLARFTLQYDFTFLAILLTARGTEDRPLCRRCPAHPLRRPRACLGGGQMDAAADQSMILTYYKLSDDVDDHNAVTGLPYRLLRRLFRRAYRRAAVAQPEFDAQARECLGRLRQLEGERSPELDRTADAFACILSSASAAYPEGSLMRRTLGELLYHLGRWIYLMDAWDDLEEDKKRGRYNPLDARFQGHAPKEKEYLNTTAVHSVRLAGAAANLMDLGSWAPVVENVLYLGLPAVQNAVLAGRWKEMRKTRRRPHERSLRSAGRQP